MFRGHYVTGTYLYGLETNRNNEGTLCNTLEIKCNGDIMNGDTKITGWGHNVTGVGTQCYGGHNERGHNVTRPNRIGKMEGKALCLARQGPAVSEDS